MLAELSTEEKKDDEALVKVQEKAPTEAPTHTPSYQVFTGLPPSEDTPQYLSSYIVSTW